MKNRSVDYQKLEFEIHPESNQQTSFFSKLVWIWNQIIESIIAVNELKIYSFRSKSGCCYWAVHDPQLGRKVFFDSEAEVRQWLDNRYYK